jgi:GH15 family glucan-1,4-alpha-glucosidase
VLHGGRVLQALTYAPSGAIIAAATTSLPEAIRGSRNWDYRFSWIRDASLTLQALWVAACPDEAADFFDFFVTAAGGVQDGSRLQVLYGVGGERHVPEHELIHLAGYRGSRPVRIGNGAWGQVQLDTFGELLSAADLLAEQVGQFSPEATDLLIHLAEETCRRWQETDSGIWELRGEPRHFLHSKLLCWAGLDRGVRLASRLRVDDERVRRWQATRDEIGAAILDQGWNDEAASFTQFFGSPELDASALMIPIVGFLPPSDPRVRATIDAVATRLTDDRGLVYRYRSDDHLGGEEGIFTLCTYWLVQCLAMAGEVARAKRLFETVTAFANDVGLLSEEIDPSSGELLGNFPQAFSHIGLINAAWAISQAEERGLSKGGATGELTKE